MGGLRTWALAVLLPVPAAAEDPLRLIPDCAGRYSATVEHLWLVDGAAADRAALRRGQFLDLIAALPGDDRAALHRRVEAKAAQRALLDRGLFGPDPGATRRAMALLAVCDRLLASG